MKALYKFLTLIIALFFTELCLAGKRLNFAEPYYDYDTVLEIASKRSSRLQDPKTAILALKTFKNFYFASSPSFASIDALIETAKDQYNTSESQMFLYTSFVQRSLGMHRMQFFASNIVFNLEIDPKNNKTLLKTALCDIYTPNLLKTGKPLFTLHDVLKSTWKTNVTLNDFVLNEMHLTERAPFRFFLIQNLIEIAQSALFQLEKELAKAFHTTQLHIVPAVIYRKTKNQPRVVFKEIIPSQEMFMINPAVFRLPMAVFVGMINFDFTPAAVALMMHQLIAPTNRSYRYQLLRKSRGLAPDLPLQHYHDILTSQGPEVYITAIFDYAQQGLGGILDDAAELFKLGIWTPFIEIPKHKTNLYIAKLAPMYRFEIEAVLLRLYKILPTFHDSVNMVSQELATRRLWLGYQTFQFLFLDHLPTKIRILIRHHLRRLYITTNNPDAYAAISLADLSIYPKYIKGDYGELVFKLKADERHMMLKNDCAYLLTLPEIHCWHLSDLVEAIGNTTNEYATLYPPHFDDLVQTIGQLAYEEEQFDNKCNYPLHNEFAKNRSKECFEDILSYLESFEPESTYPSLDRSILIFELRKFDIDNRYKMPEADFPP